MKGPPLQLSNPAYDPVLAGVIRSIADLFPPIHNPPRESSATEDDTSDPVADDVGGDQP